MTTTVDTHQTEVAKGERFEFGKNWARFLKVLNDDRIALAEKSLSDFLGRKSLTGLSFLDIGSGSGLFSLAARRMGARVYSFDYDPHSVNCTAELRRRFFPNDKLWTVERGSVLDPAYLATLGQFDIVYSWGVLHHTGAMWQALENVKPLVKINGEIYIAIYNDLGRITDRWAEIKRNYNSKKGAFALAYALGVILENEIKSFKGYVNNGGISRWVRSWTDYGVQSARGMSKWHDWIDWIGGHPYERATIEEIVDYFGKDGFKLTNLIDLSTGYGCNEFRFTRVAQLRTEIESRIPGGTSLVRRFGYRVSTLTPDVVDRLAQLTLDGGESRLWLFRSGRLIEAIAVDDNGRFSLNLSAGTARDEHVICGRIIEPTVPFNHNRGHMWAWRLPDYKAIADDSENPRRSSIYILEDGVPSPLPHSLHEAIANEGGGRFSHWGDSVYFSTSNNQSPASKLEHFKLFLPTILGD